MITEAADSMAPPVPSSGNLHHREAQDSVEAHLLQCLPMAGNLLHLSLVGDIWDSISIIIIISKPLTTRGMVTAAAEEVDVVAVINYN